MTTEQPAPPAQNVISSQPATTARPRRSMAWIVVAVLAGAIAGFGWNTIDFTQSISIGSESIQLSSWADSLLAAFIAAGAGFFAIIAISPDN